MRRLRRLAIVLVAVGLVTSAIYATGAFSSLTTSRDANVNVAGDKAGYLGLAPGANGEYTTYQNGKLQLQLNGALKGEDAPRGGGVNREAETVIESVFTITNQGAQPVGVWLEDTGEHIDFERANGGSLEREGNAVRLTPGDTVHVGLTIDTTDTDADQLDTQLIVNADSDVEGVSPQKGSGPGNDAERNGDTSSNDSQTESDSSSEANGDEGATDSSDDDEEKDTLGQVVDSAAALTFGFLLGDAGMPDGVASVDLASSPLYLLGQLLNAIAPGKADMVFELRDLLQNAANGKGLETALNAAGLLPVIGQAKGVLEMRKITTKWTDAFPSQADEMTAFLSNALIKHLPESAGVKMLSLVSDAPVQKLADEGVSVEDMIKYQDDGIDLNQVSKLRSKDVPADDIRRYVDEGVDLNRVERLRNSGLPPRAVKYVVVKGADPQQIDKLRAKDVPVKDILYYYDEGADLQQVNKLRDQGIPPYSIKQYVRQGVDLNQANKLIEQGVSKADMRTYVASGADLKKVNKLRSQDVPAEDIKYYARNDMWLGGVSKLQKRGVPPSTTRELITKIKQINNLDEYPTKKQIEILNREISGWTVKKSILEIAKAVVAHKSWKDAKSDSQTKDKNKQVDRQSKALV